MKSATLFELVDGGFFDDITFDNSWWRGGRFDMQRLEELYRIFSGRPYALKYNLKHQGMMPTWGIPRECKTVEGSEKIYEKCLKENITWEKAIGYKEPAGDILL